MAIQNQSNTMQKLRKKHIDSGINENSEIKKLNPETYLSEESKKEAILEYVEHLFAVLSIALPPISYVGHLLSKHTATLTMNRISAAISLIQEDMKDMDRRILQREDTVDACRSFFTSYLIESSEEKRKYFYYLYSNFLSLKKENLDCKIIDEYDTWRRTISNLSAPSFHILKIYHDFSRQNIDNKDIKDTIDKEIADLDIKFIDKYERELFNEGLIFGGSDGRAYYPQDIRITKAGKAFFEWIIETPENSSDKKNG